MAKKQRALRLNTMRLLEAHKIAYEPVLFSPDIHSAAGMAEAVGVDPNTVFKTLVVQRTSGRPLLVMVPGDQQIDPKALAASLGEKKVRMATHQEAEALTGLQVGGISALALLNKGFDICIDRSAQQLEQIFISAGQRGVNLRLAVSDLVRLTGARWVNATGEEGS